MLPVPPPVSGLEESVVSVREFEPRSEERHHDLEALWFSLGTEAFERLTLVPVPGVDGEDVLEFADRLAATGAWIRGEPVIVVDALGLGPADVTDAATWLERIPDTSPSVLTVVLAPSVEPASIPILRASRRVLAVVGLGVSRSSELAALERAVAPATMVGAVCLDGLSARRSTRS